MDEKNKYTAGWYKTDWELADREARQAADAKLISPSAVRTMTGEDQVFSDMPVYAAPAVQPPPKKRGKTALIVACVVLAALVLMGGTFFLFHLWDKKDADEAEQPGQQELLPPADWQMSGSEQPAPPEEPGEESREDSREEPSPVIPAAPDDGFGGYENYHDFFDFFYGSSSGPSFVECTMDRAETGADIELELLPYSQELSLQEIYAQCIDSIVGITAQAYDGEYWGTGVIMTEDGYIITNAHVLEGVESAQVSTYAGEEYDARLVGLDNRTDLAVLKIEATGLKPASFGNSDELSVGDRVAAIGNPLGEELRGTMTDGIVSSINRYMDYDGRAMSMIQTNAALNEGNSGGALVDMCGHVVGITNMKMYSTGEYYEGLGFAIPSTLVKSVVDDLIAQGRVTGRPGIGITAGAVPEEVAERYDVPQGVYVTEVAEDSDAFRKGVQPGDIITEVNGQAVSSVNEVNEIKNELSVGDTLTMTIYRDGEILTIDVVLIEMQS